MKWSAKTRYALAVLVLLAKANQTVSLNVIATRLGLSKIYLEQVLATLRSHHLVVAQKGPSGGYRLNGQPTVLMVLMAMEPEMSAVSHQDFADEPMNRLLEDSVYAPLFQIIRTFLSEHPITTLAEQYTDVPMYYI